MALRPLLAEIGIAILASAAPAVAPNGQAVLALDAADNTLKVSINGAPFEAVGGGSSSGLLGPADGTRNYATVSIGAADGTLTGTDNWAIGVSALTALTTGSRNIAIGNYAADAMDDGGDIVAIGHEALTTWTGDNLDWCRGIVAVGSGALRSAFGLSFDSPAAVAIGYHAAYTTYNGHSIVAIGGRALELATGLGDTLNAIGTVAIGGGCLSKVGKYGGTVAVGYGVCGAGTERGEVYGCVLAGQNILSVSPQSSSRRLGGDVFIGYGAGGNGRWRTTINTSTWVGANVAIGPAALNGSGTVDDNYGSSNVAIGSRALYSNSTGNYNVGIGNDSLLYATTGNNNVALGYQAGDTLTTGGANTILGAGADVATNSFTGSIVIGYHVVGSASYSLALGYAGVQVLRSFSMNSDTTSVLDLNAGLRQKYGTVATSSTLNRSQIVVEQTASGITTTMWSSPQTGDTVTIKNNSGGSNTLDGGTPNIEGVNTLPIADGEAITLCYNGTEWLVI